MTMTKLTTICLAILLIALQGCSHLNKKQIDQDLTFNNISAHPFCQKLLGSSNWGTLSDNEKDVTSLWQQFNQHYKNDNKRNIAIFIDGTSNTKKSNTNVWKLYTLATKKACNGESKVIPYYHKGVGTERFFITRTIGSITGFGVDKRI